jgi:hypothetical protein
MSYNITKLFCCLDDFAKVYEAWERSRVIGTPGSRRRPGKLSLSEMLFIAVLYHIEKFKDFKHFYLYGILHKHRDKFGDLPCYARFVQLMPRLIVPLAIFLQSLSGERTGIYFADSTKLAVCHNKRINRNRVFAGLAKRGKTSMGWFYGFKLHMVINHKGEIVAVKITAGNVDDAKIIERLTEGLTGKCYADRGYIGRKLFERLFRKGLQLIVSIRKNMKNKLLPLLDKFLLRKRFLIETLFGVLKNSLNLEHSRHRSPLNFLVNTLACLVAYCFKNNKPALKSAATALSHN